MEELVTEFRAASEAEQNAFIRVISIHILIRTDTAFEKTEEAYAPLEAFFAGDKSAEAVAAAKACIATVIDPSKSKVARHVAQGLLMVCNGDVTAFPHLYFHNVVIVMCFSAFRRGNKHGEIYNLRETLQHVIDNPRIDPTPFQIHQ